MIYGYTVSLLMQAGCSEVSSQSVIHDACWPLLPRQRVSDWSPDDWPAARCWLIYSGPAPSWHGLQAGCMHALVTKMSGTLHGRAWLMQESQMDQIKAHTRNQKPAISL